MYKCNKCGKSFLRNSDNFHKSEKSKDGLYWVCKECSNKKRKELYGSDTAKEKKKTANAKWRRDNQDHIKKYRKEYREKNKDSISEKAHKRYLQDKDNKPKPPKDTSFKRHLKRFYGMEPETYFDMLNKQNGVCAICGKEDDGSGKRLHVDHNHVTGKIRGLLCRSCNAGLGHFKDNQHLLDGAIKYLKNNE